MRIFSVRTVLLASVAACASHVTPALAQENPATSPELPVNQETEAEAAEASDSEIIVTARRRDEVLLDVPIAVTAYSGEQLDRQGGARHH